MPFLGNTPEFVVVDTQKQTISADGSTSYALSSPVDSATSIEVFVNNIRQEPDVAYTVSGQTITFANTVSNTDSVYVVFQGKPISTSARFVPALNSISTAILQDDAVTGAKIASNTITLDNVTFEVGGAARGKNLVINGDMKVAQRPQLANTANSVSNVSNQSAYFFVDRFRVYNFATANATIEYSTDAPEGFTNSLRIAMEETKSISVVGLLGILYHIEAKDLGALKKGTPNAANTTLSFHTKTNFPGTYQLNIFDPQNNRQTSKRFTISQSNTWTRHEITVIGDTDANGAISYNSNTGIILEWFFDAGTNYQSGEISDGEWAGAAPANSFINCTSGFAQTLGNEMFLAGVQYEVGDEATEFEYKSYAQTLSECERYFQVMKPFGTNLGFFTSHFGGSSAYYPVEFRTPMRVTPTANIQNSSIQYYSYAGVWTNTTLGANFVSPINGIFSAAADGDGRGKLMRTGTAGTDPVPIGLVSAELT